jgi:two-component system response regulator YesN
MNMFKVLIVDDEIWTRKEIRSLIESSGLDLQVAGEAENGREACDAILHTHPHIVITDIKMPLMDGMELLRWVEEHKFSCKVIVLSGYGDFEYTRKAIHYRAFDYVLKPLQEAELAVVLTRVMEEISKDTALQQNAFYQQLKMNKGLSLLRDRLLNGILAERLVDEHEMILGCEELNLTLPDHGYVVATVKFFEAYERVVNQYKEDWDLFDFAVRNILEELVPRMGVYFQNTTCKNEYLLILQARGNSRAASEFACVLRNELERCLKLPVWISLGGQHKSYVHLSQSYQESVQAIMQSPVQRVGCLAVYEKDQQPPLQQPTYEKAWDQLSTLLTLYGETRANAQMHSILNQLEPLLNPPWELGITWRSMRTGLFRLILVLEQWLLSGNLPDEELDELLQMLKKNLDELDIYAIRTHIGSMLELVVKEQADSKNKKGKELINAIKRYAEDHHAEVTLDEVAQTFSINKNYFCSLFKQVTGVTFSDYLVDVRMKKAEVLLIHSDLRISDIAQKVGYLDQRYFSQIFRKHHGLTPGEFRGKQR